MLLLTLLVVGGEEGGGDGGVRLVTMIIDVASKLSGVSLIIDQLQL